MLKKPGWKPEELGGVQPLKKVSPQTFRKYNTEISSGLTNYAFVQFVIVLLGTTAFLVLQTQPLFKGNYLLKIIVASLIILSLLTIGGIFEKKNWAPVFEYLRIAATAALVLVLLKDSSLIFAIGAVTAVVALLSAFWFARFLNEFQIKVPQHASSNI